MSSSRKRKAPDAAPVSAEDLSDNNTAAADARDEKPLVWATKASLKEMRHRVRSVVDETTANKLAGTATSSGPGAVAGRSRSGGGGGGEAAAAAAAATDPKQDPTTTAYLRAFHAAVASKVQAMCEVQDPRESREEDQPFEDVIQFCDEVQAARAKLVATRGRVAGLSAATCSDALRVSQAADDRACSVLEASTEHARIEKKTGCPLPLAPAAAAANGSSGGGSSNGGGSGSGGGGDSGDSGGDNDDDDDNDNNAGVVAVPTYSGVDASVLEPKVSRLIGKLSELPGPLKALLQEIPELTASLAVSVQNVEAVMRTGESRTEALLAKTPPTPLPGKKGKGATAGGVDDERPPPEEVRSAARGARVGQARKQWQAEGVGVVGGIFN